MTAETLFDAFRSDKRELTGNPSIGLTQDEVDAIEAIRSKWKAERPAVMALGDPAAFFSAVRQSFGSLEQSQVDGFNRLLKAMGAAAWPISYVADGLATDWHETAKKMQPVEEAFWKDDAWRRKNLRYYPWHGRGDVQLTWERNYRRADDELGLGGRLVADPALALDPEISARVLVKGMEQGWFTGKKLADYLPRTAASRVQFREARRIINGTDKADLIAGYALQLQTALALGGWA